MLFIKHFNLKILLILFILLLNFIFSLLIYSPITPIVQANELKNIDEFESSEYSIEYQKYLNLSDSEKEAYGVIPRMYNIPLDTLYNNKSNNLLNSGYQSSILPSSFNLADKTPIKVEDQGSYGICWAFASLKCLETNIALTTR